MSAAGGAAIGDSSVDENSGQRNAFVTPPTWREETEGPWFGPGKPSTVIDGRRVRRGDPRYPFYIRPFPSSTGSAAVTDGITAYKAALMDRYPGAADRLRYLEDVTYGRGHSWLPVIRKYRQNHGWSMPDSSVRPSREEDRGGGGRYEPPPRDGGGSAARRPDRDVFPGTARAEVIPGELIEIGSGPTASEIYAHTQRAARIVMEDQHRRAEAQAIVDATRRIAGVVDAGRPTAASSFMSGAQDLLYGAFGIARGTPAGRLMFPGGQTMAPVDSVPHVVRQNRMSGRGAYQESRAQMGIPC